MFRKPLLAFTGVAALSALAFAPLVNPGTVASADGKARAVTAGQSLAPETAAIDRALTQAENLQLVDCVAGMAGPFHCNNVDLLDVAPTAGFGGGHGSDSWGWTDDDGTEYVIVTSGVGTGFFRLAEDGTAGYLGTAERTDTADRILWNDVKVVNDHAYISSEDNAFGLQVVDLNAVAELPEIPLGTGRGVVEQAGAVEGDGAHNVVGFEERGIVAMSLTRDEVCGNDVIFYDVSETPADPQRLGCVDVNASNGSHDTQCVTYRGPDDDFNGTNHPEGLASDICIMFQEGSGVFVYDVSEITRDRLPDGEATMLTRFEYEDVAYTHQGWLTDDHRWVIFGDELDESGALGSGANLNTATYYIDLEDLDVGAAVAASPVPGANSDLVGEWNNPNTFAIDHNMYVVGDLVYQANYGAGLRVLRFSDESLEAGGEGAFEEVAYFDTYPGPGPAEFYGAWNTYPFFESGRIVLSDFQSGLLILDVHDAIENPEG